MRPRVGAANEVSVGVVHVDVALGARRRPGLLFWITTPRTGDRSRECGLGIGGIERPQLPASGVRDELAKRPFAVHLRDDERAVDGKPLGLDDDDLAIDEFGRHAVTQHQQRERLRAGAITGIWVDGDDRDGLARCHGARRE